MARVRCDGWSRGGVFSIGRTTEWIQCTSDAIVILEVEQDNEITKQNACMACWKHAIASKIRIISVIPIEVE